ncbi:MAG: BNR repeat-containing protein [Bacteroidales bacterium]|nr:BNR repeat-containing protein [Bacteroidales bacterium]
MKLRLCTILSGVLFVLLLGSCSEDSVTSNEKDDGYRGIWYMNQPLESVYKYKYSGGLGTYCAKHKPFAIYCDKVGKTFFCYGGTTRDSNRQLIHMVSYYDHKKKTVPRPTILLDKKTDDAHDNPVISVDDKGYIWIFSTSHGTNRPSYIHRSKKPYDIDAFELIDATRLENGKEVPITNFSYLQAWHLPQQGFFCFFTKYGWDSERTICFMTSRDGIKWSAWQRLATIANGHYQISGVTTRKAASAFNYHPIQSGLNYRTNLYYVETYDFGETWSSADGQKLRLPLTETNNTALVRDYESEGLKVYLKDIRFDQDGRPVILYITSKGYESGPKNDPRTWTIAYWTGKQWDIQPVTTSDNNYDMGSLFIGKDGTWSIIAPTGTGPQPYNPGGEMAVWESKDKGMTWKQLRQITRASRHNHNYARASVFAHPDFYALWADGHGREPSESNLYFCNRAGDVYALPRRMSDSFEKPELVEPGAPADTNKLRR